MKTEEEIAELERKIEALNAENSMLKLEKSLAEDLSERRRVRILELERQLYGRRSEKKLPSYAQAQLSLFSEQENEALIEEEKKAAAAIDDIKKEAEKRRKSKATPQRASSRRVYRLPSDMERRTTTLLPEGIHLEDYDIIGTDVCERLQLEPSKFYVERIVSPILRLKSEKTATRPRLLQKKFEANILPGSYAGSTLLSQMVIDKFQYHIPEYRQADRFKGEGIEIPTSSINNWIHALADVMYPLYAALRNRILSSDYIQVDETVSRINDSKGKVRKGYTWAVRDASGEKRGILFHYDGGSRSGEVIYALLKDFRGALQSDGYAAYSAYENKIGVTPLGCLAHVRRKFEHASTTNPAAVKMLEYIATLYELEKNLKERNATYEEIKSERKEKAYGLLQLMEAWMKAENNSCTPGSELGKAISYAFGMWPRIARYCFEGRYNIDNNLIEQRIRPLAMGRKNYLFSGNDKGAKDNAIFYSFIGSCQEVGIEPLAWFNATLLKLKDNMSEEDIIKLLPKMESESL